MRKTAVTKTVKRTWIPFVIVVVSAIATLVVGRLHKVFGAENLNAHAGAGIEIVQFNPKIVTYEVVGPPETTASINYWDADANTHQIDAAALPWSYTISTTLPAVSANVMVQINGDYIGCRISVNGVIRDERKANGVKAQTFCLVKAA
ncbi:MmpS family transport accessory protein [Mycobacterium talmoniae]|uniref:Siderophore export accessory protein MmpS5 n=1 Tax=Mycobacterium talmoniae TaxID=1858794 RepID=A0A1S1NKX2_9MYCO|nr:MmpS family transport accessory protein [Mycobacterium talmoniae]OHV06953.1 hypothetical protein BKN37_00520 [Mycobacterium talmoniae]PQM48043.1 Siderophore export accessory protein MmpS5 [Mycobacterium talmoniae]